MTSPATSVPLPVEYPANLIYAQNMLAISLSQLQRVETRKVMLQLLLHEHYQREKAYAAAEAIAVLEPAIAVLRGASGARRDDSAPEHIQVAHAAGAVAAAAAAAAAGGQAPVDAPEDLQRHRRRLANGFKGALLLLLLDANTAWFILYLFVVFLWLVGYFDPFAEWMQRRAPGQGVTLEQQLVQLQQRQRNAAAEGPAGGGQAAAAGRERQQEVDRRPEPDGREDGTNAQDSDSSAPAGNAGPAEVDTVVAGAHGHVVEGGAADAPEAAAQAPDLPPYGHRFFYQLVVMFFLTLVPWWNPNPQYVQ